jgi:hypothetical protein
VVGQFRQINENGKRFGTCVLESGIWNPQDLPDVKRIGGKKELLPDSTHRAP